MKSLLTTLILMLAVVASVQQTNAQDGRLYGQETEQTINMRVGKQKRASRSRINIKFVSLIEDSRCPTDTRCIQAGNASIKVTVSKAGSDPVTLEVNTNSGVKGTRFDNYWIELASLTPTPASNVRLNRNAYTATFVIRRLSR